MDKCEVQNQEGWDEEEIRRNEPYPYLSVPWDKEEDGSAAYDKAPDWIHH